MKEAGCLLVGRSLQAEDKVLFKRVVKQGRTVGETRLRIDRDFFPPFNSNLILFTQEVFTVNNHCNVGQTFFVQGEFIKVAYNTLLVV